MTTKEKLYKIIFESDTAKGKTFDVILLWLILLSILTAAIESIPDLNPGLYQFLDIAEWIFTILFSIEYIVRIIISSKPKKYISSFWGIIDLIAILPAYLSIFLVGYHYLLIVRIFRLLRVFRILKMVRFNSEALSLIRAMKDSFYKISFFFSVVLVTVVLLGTVMYVIEGGQNGFSSIPQSIYWAIITITTVGYGDIVPHTVLGKFVSSFIMLIGYAIIAIPTGIITGSIIKSKNDSIDELICPTCNKKTHKHANYCDNCGHKL